MKLATWNIGSLYKNYDDYIITVQNQIQNCNIDILCLQEFPNISSLFEKIYLCGNFNYHYFVECSPSHVFVGGNMGIAVFSKVPLKQVGIFKLQKPQITVTYHGHIETLHDKVFLAVETQFNKERYLIFSGHGFSFHRYGLDYRNDLFEFEYQPLDNILTQIIQSQTYDHIIIGGDFNCEDATQYIPCLSNKFYDVFQNDATRPSRRKTDAIFLQKETNYIKKEIFESNMDHFMLIIER